MVEDYVPDRLEFDLASTAKSISHADAGRGHASMAAISTARRRPSLELDGEVVVAAGAASGRAFRLPVRPGRRGGRDHAGSRSTTCRRPTRTARRRSRVDARQAAGDHAPAGGAGRRCAWRKPAAARSSASSSLPVTPATPMIGVKPLFSGRSLGEGDNADLRRRSWPRPTAARSRAHGLRYELLKVETRYQWYRRDGRWDLRAGQDHQARRRRPASTSPPTSRRASRCRCTGAAIGWKSRAHDRNGPVTSVALRRRLVCRGQRRYARPARDRARQAGISRRATP